MPLLLLLVLFAIADFVVLFSLGDQIGLLATLIWIFVSAGIGIHLIRRESMLTFQRARERFARGELPSRDLLAGASLLMAGALLVAPGFLSDLCGLLLLLPGSGKLIRSRFNATPGRTRPGAERVDEATADWDSARHTSRNSHRPRQGPTETLEGEYEEKRGDRPKS